MDISFQNPVYLSFLPFVLLLVYWSYSYTTSYVTFWKAIWFTGTGICLVIAASSPMLTLSGADVHQILLVDVSESTSFEKNNLKQQIDDLSQTLKRNDKISILLFARNSRWLLQRASIDQVSDGIERFESTRAEITASGSRPADALRAALMSRASDETEIAVLLSDGQFPPNQLQEFISVANNAQLPVSTRLVRTGTLQDVWIQSISSPSYVHPGEPFEITVTLRSSSNYDGELRITDGASSRVVRTVPFSMQENQLRTFRMNLNPGNKVTRRYGVTVHTEQNEWTVKNNSYEFGVRSSDAFRALWIGNKSLYRRITPIVSDESITFEYSAEPAEPDSYDLFLIAGPSSGTTEQWKEHVASAVRQRGSGLIMLGTENSFGIGGWGKTPVEDLLPVRVYPPDSLSLSILLDVSGSMSQPPEQTGSAQSSKLTVARNALNRSLDLLNPTDLLELIAFSNQADSLRPLKPIGEKTALPSLLNQLSAGGGTKLLPAMKKGITSLIESGRNNRFLFIFTDGQLKEKLSKYERLADRAAENNIRLIVFSTGDREDRSILRALTKREENGRVIPLESINDLQRALKQELQRIRKFIHRKSIKTRPDTTDTSNFLSIRSEQIPSRTGPYHRVTEKPYALIPLRSTTDDVLVAGWQPGEGRSVALTPLYDNPDAHSGSDWSAWLELLQRSIKWSLPERPSNWRLGSELDRNQLKVYLEYTGDRRDITSFVATGTLKKNGNWERTNIPGTPLTRRRIEFKTPRPPTGSYQFHAKVTFGSQDTQLSIPVNIPVQREYLHPSADEDAMKTIVRRTGGRIVTSARDLTEFIKDRSRKEKKEFPLTRYVLLLATTAMLLTVVRV